MSQSKLSAAVNVEKEFAIQHVFKDVMTLVNGENHYGATEMHCGFPWRLIFTKNANGSIIGLECLHHDLRWSVGAKMVIELYYLRYPKSGMHTCAIFNARKPVHTVKSLSRKELRDFSRPDGNLIVGIHVKIEEIVAGPERDRRFDDVKAKEFSDVTLLVKNCKFHVNKMYLAMHSTYFESMFSRNFAESERPEIELKDMDPEYFQNFLELIYGESLVTDNTVEEILDLADFFGAKTAIKRCHQFLLKNSELALYRKFDVAIKHGFEDIKKKCLSDMKTKDDLRNVIPHDPAHFEPAVWAELLEKSFTL